MPVQLIELKRIPSAEQQSEHILATYELSHSNNVTTLRQTVKVALMPWGIEFRYSLHDFKAETFEEGRVRLADWFERMAIALREPGKIDDKLPLYSGERE